MKKFDGMPAIEILYQRLNLSKKLDNIVIATSRNQSNLKLVNFCKEKKFDFFLGSESNVLKRYYDTNKKKKLMSILEAIEISYKLLEENSRVSMSVKHEISHVSNTCTVTCVKNCKNKTVG